MSLLDDVSIVVTPNGYKAGTLFGVIPVPSEGIEKIDNGTFITSDLSDFSAVYADQAIVSEELKVTLNTANGYGFSRFTFTAEIGKRYRILASCKQGTSNGTLVNDDSGIDLPSSGTITGEWSYDEIGIATSTTCKVRLQAHGASGVYGLFDNISVKEYTSADMDVTRETAATRVDENGLVNYAEVIGGEEVACGNFECAVPLDSWTEGTGWLINGGKANASGTSTPMTQTVDGFIAGKTYKVSFEVTSVTRGYVRVYAYVGASGSFTNIFSSTQLEIGIYEGVFEFGGTNKALRFYGSLGGAGTFIGSIDNISVKEVTRDNVPRIDYTGGGCPHILAEPQRTNLVTYSEDFSQSYWTKTGTSVISGFTSPDGTANAYKMTEDSATSVHKISNNSAISNSFQSQSIFIKYDSSQQFIQTTSSRSISNYVNFDILNKTLTNYGTSVGKIVELSSGWLRLEVYHDSSTTAYWHFITSLTASWSESYLGTGKHLLIFGAQVEEGSYATSYIPNFGTALGVTRNQDIFTRDGIGSLINSTEGVLFVEMAALSDDGTIRSITLSDGTNSNRVYIGFESFQRIQFNIKSSTSTIFNYYEVVSDITVNSKLAIKYKSSDFSVWLDGIEIANQTSGAVPINLNKLSFDDGAGTNLFFGKVKQLQVYDTALTDEQLLQLTGESGTDFYESYAEMASALTYTIQ